MDRVKILWIPAVKSTKIRGQQDSRDGSILRPGSCTIEPGDIQLKCSQQKLPNNEKSSQRSNLNIKYSCLKSASTISSIFFIISPIMLKLYTELRLCNYFCCVFAFSYSFSNYEQKTGKNNAVLKDNNSNNFKLRVNFLSKCVLDTMLSNATDGDF